MFGGAPQAHGVSPENVPLLPEIHHKLGGIISLLERDLIAKPFEVADSASLHGIMVSLFKVGAAKLLIRFFLLENVIDNDQNTMGDRNECLLLSNALTVVIRNETFIDGEVLNYLLKKLRGQHLTPRQEECASLIAQGLSNDEIALRMGYLNTRGGPNIGPLENLVSELYNFFAIEGLPSDPGRRVLLAHAYEAYAGLRPA